MQTLLSFMNISLPMYCKFVINNWHFFGDIFKPFFNNAFSKSSNFAIWEPFDGVNRKDCPLLLHSTSFSVSSLKLHLYRIAILRGIYSIPWAFCDTDRMHYQSKELFCNISLNVLTASRSEMHPLGLIQTTSCTWSFPILRICLWVMDKPNCFFFAILTFKCLKPVTSLLSWVRFLLINITGLE